MRRPGRSPDGGAGRRRRPRGGHVTDAGVRVAEHPNAGRTTTASTWITHDTTDAKVSVTLFLTEDRAPDTIEIDALTGDGTRALTQVVLRDCADIIGDRPRNPRLQPWGGKGAQTCAGLPRTA